MPPTLRRFSPFSVENAVLSYVQDRTFVQAEYVCSCRPQLMETPSEFVSSDGSKICHQKYASNFYEDGQVLVNGVQDTYLCVQVIVLDKPINRTESAIRPRRIAKYIHPNCSSSLCQ